MNPILENRITDFFADEQPQTRRVFHGRGHLYPGLEHICIDWFKPSVLITAHAPIVNCETLANSIRSADKFGQIESIILQKRYAMGAPSELLAGSQLESTTVKEGILLFEVHPGQQQNAGLFLDMRLLREWLQLHSMDKNVLNLFAYTCSLSVAAVAGGATHVTNVDMNKTSLKWGAKNHQLNGQDPRRVRSIPHNLFRSWGRIKRYGRYDLVIIDPPTRQPGSFDVVKNYAAVLGKLKQLCNPGADIIATINSPFLDADYLIEQFAQHLPHARFIESIPVAPEFVDKFPERGLKICRFSLDHTPDL